MLVQSMNDEEVRREMEKEIPVLMRKTGFHLEKVKKAMRKAKINKLTKFYDYVSIYKNNWIYGFFIEDLKHDKSEITWLAYQQYEGKGLTAITILPNDHHIIIITEHFFRRYNERNKLNLSTTNEIMKKFLSDMQFSHYVETKQRTDNIKEIQISIDSGTALGTINKNTNVIRYNTFIPNDMLNKNQSTTKDFLENMRLLKS